MEILEWKSLQILQAQRRMDQTLPNLVEFSYLNYRNLVIQAEKQIVNQSMGMIETFGYSYLIVDYIHWICGRYSISGHNIYEFCFHFGAT